MSGPEARIQQRIHKALTARGVFCFKIHGSESMMAGLPDLICCVDGKFLGLEVKTPLTLDNVSPRQRYVKGLIEASSGQCHIVASIADAMAIIDRMRA